MKMNAASKIYTALILAFLYLPIAVLIFFSFNEANSTSVFTGFSLQWYRELFADRETLKTLYNTLIIAVLSSAIATVIGTAAAVGIQSLGKWSKKLVMGVTNLPLMNPDIVTGVAMMLLFVFIMGLFGGTEILGFWTILIAHVTFNLPYVILSVNPKLRQLDPHLVEAAQDLGCPGRKAFFKVVLPNIMPGIVTGFIMAFTLSIDDFVISYFVSGPSFQTLPLRIYAMTKRRVEPSINALSTLIFVVVLVLLIIINVRQATDEKKLKKNIISAKNAGTK
ncbi:MAG: ABC transporter permease [Clostridia bacterium]|nr:ABC transporter permease [Clostridia bacterium]